MACEGVELDGGAACPPSQRHHFPGCSLSSFAHQQASITMGTGMHVPDGHLLRPDRLQYSVLGRDRTAALAVCASDIFSVIFCTPACSFGFALVRRQLAQPGGTTHPLSALQPPGPLEQAAEEALCPLKPRRHSLKHFPHSPLTPTELIIPSHLKPTTHNRLLSISPPPPPSRQVWRASALPHAVCNKLSLLKFPIFNAPRGGG